MDPGDDGFQGMLGEFRAVRKERGIRIVEKLGELGVDIDINVVLAKAGDGALGRPHIAEAIIEGGHASDFGEVFAKYIGEDCPAYVEKYKMGPRDAVTHIHRAGGLAFVAHPGYYLEDESTFDEILDEGFDGIEVHHPQHKSNVVNRLLAIAQRRRLLVSGGSDFHGFAGRANMGDPKVSYELLQRIRERLT
jgi:predicted metal-dependent phosphoesterase TrpH